jgi:alanine racemase
VDVLRAGAPVIELSGSVLRHNLQALKRRTRSRVRAVVKANGYGFGLERIVAELDGTADGFVVSEIEGLRRVRALTDAPTAVLLDLGPEHALRVVALAGIPNVARRASLMALAARSDAATLTVRVGLRLAAGWSAIEMDEAVAFAGAIAGAGMRVELWTHLSSPASEMDDRERFSKFVAIFRETGAAVVGEDMESTFPAARADSHGTTVRIGVGLFGAGGLTCAIGVHAPIIERLRSDGTLRASYSADELPKGTDVMVVRCGYSNGFPRVTRPYRRVLSVGMQNSIVLGHDVQEQFALLGPDDDLDELAGAAAILPHQIVTGLGAIMNLIDNGRSVR